MSFIYPLFLLAGVAIGIPVFIHLFNLRRYKTVFFPHTRFLKNIHLRSQKQAQIRYKWLLAARILFLISLILAFAQPLLKHTSQDKTDEGLKVIYIDNSASMSLKQGARTLLDIEKETAGKQIKQAPQGSRFLLLTNDKPVAYQPVAAEKALDELNTIDFSSSSKTAAQTLGFIQGLMQAEALSHAQVFYYSDFQKTVFPETPNEKDLANIDFYGIPVRNKTPANVYIDTAVLSAPVLQSGQTNRLVVTTRYIGDAPEENPVLQLRVNEQLKAAGTLHFNERKESVDTLSFQVNEAGWQRITLTLNDAVRFDDTFRIAARSNNNLSVLVLNEQQANPFIQAAFRAYQGFRMDNKSLNENVDWTPYNLIILNGVTQGNSALSRQIQSALQRGQSIALFPGKTRELTALNELFVSVAGIHFTSRDTVSQTAASLLQNSDLVKDIFDRVPENVQLPRAAWHYKIKADLNANQQSVITFRSGDPLLAQYTPSRGKLYVLSTPLDLQESDFSGSYFFAPFLYRMASQSQTGNVFAATAGSEQSVYIAYQNNGERNMLHLTGYGNDMIPPQRVSGAGLDVFAGKMVRLAGFYTLAAPGSDTIQIAMNEDRGESQLEVWELNVLQKQWKNEHIKWANVNEKDPFPSVSSGSFALWKVCVILALIMVAAETCLLASGYQKTSIVAS